jgi:hypothetical protein
MNGFYHNISPNSGKSCYGRKSAHRSRMRHKRHKELTSGLQRSWLHKGMPQSASPPLANAAPLSVHLDSGLDAAHGHNRTHTARYGMTVEKHCSGEGK